MVEHKVVKFPTDKVRPTLDPFNSETVTRMYADCRRYGRPYPLSVFTFEDLGIEDLQSGSSSSSFSSSKE